MPGHPVIDADGHVLLECVPEWTRLVPSDEAERIEAALLSHRTHPNDRGTRKEEIYQSIRDRNKSTGGWDPAVRLRDMTSEGIDTAMLFGTEIALNQDAYSPAVCRAYNDWLADYCAADRRRLKGVAMVPLANIQEARRELRRAVRDLGFTAVFMKPSVGGRTLDVEHFHPLYAEAQELNIPVLFHVPHGAAGVLKREFHYDFVRGHAAFHPLSSMLALMDVLYSGLVERFPTLRFGFMEGQAGWAPWFLWRLDEQHEEYMHRPGMKRVLRKLPSEYLAEDRLFISCDPEEKYLGFAASEGLEDYIVWASDYPHSDGIFPGAVTTFLGQRGLTDVQKRKILHDNSLALFYGKRTV